MRSETAFDGDRWAKGIPLLTLDVVRPLYGHVGLEPRDPDRLRAVLRQGMIEARRRFVTNASVPATAEQVASSVRNALDSEDARVLEQWITSVFHAKPTDNAELRQWTTLLQHCRRDETLWNGFFVSAQHARQALAKFARALDLGEFDERYRELTTVTLSDWDLHLYALHFFDDDDSEGTPNGPYLWLAPTVRDHQALRFWRWLTRALDEPELMHFRQRAASIAQHEGWVLPAPPTDATDVPSEP